MDNLIHLEIVTPSKVFFDDDVKSLTAPGFEGGFQILPKHAPYITIMVPGKVKINTKDNRSLLFATSGGTVEVHQNKITMLAESIIPKEEINTQEAETEKKEAEQLLQKKEPGIDKNAALQRLNTAKAKLKVASEIRN
ncbi:MAG TPA: ATP synthase F1 subunit epsilon [Ignavibacteria bacterium]